MKKTPFPIILSFILSLFFMVPLTGCGEKGKIDNSSSDNGSVAVTIIWPDEGASPRSPQTKASSSIHCEEKGISTLIIEIYDENPATFRVNNECDCIDGDMTISDIPAGFNRTCLVSGKDIDGHVVFLGKAKGIIVSSGARVSVSVHMVRLDNPTPAVTIDSPEDNAEFWLGHRIAFSGSAKDAGNVMLTGDAMVWTSDRVGQIGTGVGFSTQELPVGQHVITLTATDDYNAVSDASITITIKENSLPVATINSPSDGVFNTGETISFVGTGRDNEDGDLSGNQLQWTSDIDGELDAGVSFTTNNLSVGHHTITLRATDSAGEVDTDSVEITVTTAPIATITLPTEGVYGYGETIVFEGMGDDPEDGPLFGSHLQWHSSIDGNINEGSSFSKSNLSAGIHTITLTAMDLDGGQGIQTRSITINRNPTAAITNPSNNNYNYGESILFEGSGADPDEGVLTDEHLQWTSNIDGTLGYGESIEIGTLSPGEHTITLTVTDVYGESDHDEITMTINNIWNRTIGGEGVDKFQSMQTTSDGGLILAGSTTSFGAGGYDAWLIKTDIWGNVSWTEPKTFGGTENDYARSAQQTSDGGFIIVGYTASSGEGGYYAWLIKTDSAGNETWPEPKTFGGTGNDYAYSVQQTSDGGFIIAGFTYISEERGYDAWLIKTYANGTENWSKTFGSANDDYFNSVQQTSDGGFIIAGSYSSGILIPPYAWLIKTDGNGNEIWSETFGDTELAYRAYSAQETSDGGFIFAGRVNSLLGPGDSALLIKVDRSGNETWSQQVGSGGSGFFTFVQETSDSGFILAGKTSYMNYVAWLIKTDESGNEEWSKSYGNTDSEFASSVQEMSDGGFIFAGGTSDDASLIKTDKDGNSGDFIIHTTIPNP